MFTLTAVSPTEKIFLREKVRPLDTPVVLFAGDIAHVQINLYSDSYCHNGSLRLFGGAAARAVKVRRVGYVPAIHDVPLAHDDYYRVSEDRLYPDVLEPCDIRHLHTHNYEMNQPFFLTIADSDKIEPGDHRITVRFFTDDEKRAETSFILRKIPAALPEKKCIYTNWMHYDSFVNHHHVKLFSRDFYKLFGSYLDAAVYGGQDMLLIPIFTPAFDTLIGGERKTAQLLDIREKDGKYTFDFSKMRKFLDFVQKRGIRYFEMPPFFTQWGALHAPKILVRGADGRLRRRFGWETDSLSDEYKNFLCQLIPALVSEFAALGIEERVFFHVSDEPQPAQAERWHACKDLIFPLIGNCKTIDACSDPIFAGKTDREYAVCCEDHLDKFLAADIRPRCTYYCCNPTANYYPNRFLAMPLAREIVLGAMLYKYDIELFLQWGFNFYNSMESRRPINPYNNTDADAIFPAGDGFVVYPDYAGFGANPSLRLFGMRECFRLLRMLMLLEAQEGREQVDAFLAGEGITALNAYPRQDGWLDGFTARLADRIALHL